MKKFNNNNNHQNNKKKHKYIPNDKADMMSNPHNMEKLALQVFRNIKRAKGKIDPIDLDRFKYPAFLNSAYSSISKEKRKAEYVRYAIWFTYCQQNQQQDPIALEIFRKHDQLIGIYDDILITLENIRQSGDPTFIYGLASRLGNFRGNI